MTANEVRKKCRTVLTINISGVNMLLCCGALLVLELCLQVTPSLTANIFNLSKGLLYFKGNDIIHKMTELKFTSLNLPLSALQAAAHTTK
jgi:hypothetical protein